MTETNSPLTRFERRRLEREAKRQGTYSGQSFWRYLFLWGGIIVILGLIIWGLVLAATKPQSIVAKTLSLPLGNSDWFIGASTAPVTLVEYSDFQCPACASYAPLVEQLAEDFPDTLAIAYRHFPLDSIHANARLAAQASEAAGQQGKFWPMLGELFKYQNDWSQVSNPLELFERYAQAVGVNLVQFRKDLSSNLVKQAIEADFNSGVASGVDSTPSFFLNGRRIVNPSSYEEFASLISEALTSGQNNVATTTSQ